MIVDKSFELDYVGKGTPHNGIDTNRPTFKPFWEVQYLNNGLLFGGTKKECINWMAEFYLDFYHKKDTTEVEAEKKALEWVKKCTKEAS
tara:strand:+ start:2069 stop:2335 length:267 start_codon:yes stop_codon:yes gene_type:complete